VKHAHERDEILTIAAANVETAGEPLLAFLQLLPSFGAAHPIAA
jgi:hypothetical protein